MVNINTENLIERNDLMNRCEITTLAGLHYRIKKIGKVYPTRRFSGKTYYEKKDAEEIIAFVGHTPKHKSTAGG